MSRSGIDSTDSRLADNDILEQGRYTKQMSDILQQMAKVLEQRKSAAPDSSYVASLYAGGLDTILKKVGEEAAETIIAAKNGDKEQILYETADLWFHTLVMLAHQGLGPQDILVELERRFGTSRSEEHTSELQSH